MKVLLIDDDEEFSSMLAEYLESENCDCTCTSDPYKGAELAMSGTYEVVLLDVMMPKLDGIEILRRIRRVSMLPVLMLTAKGDGIDRVAGLELGADDYIAKPVYPREVVARLRAVLRRTHPDTSQPDAGKDLSIGSLRISPSRREVYLNDRPCALTLTEFNILILLAQNAQEVISKDELSERVLNRKREPYDRSIDVHVSNIRHKFSMHDHAPDIETIRSFGYRLRSV